MDIAVITNHLLVKERWFTRNVSILSSRKRVYYRSRSKDVTAHTSKGKQIRFTSVLSESIKVLSRHHRVLWTGKMRGVLLLHSS